MLVTQLYSDTVLNYIAYFFSFVSYRLKKTEEVQGHLTKGTIKTVEKTSKI